MLLKIDKNIPLNGESYIKLPDVIKSKGAVINVQNKDNRCFEYAILSAQHHDKIKTNPERPSKYKEHLGKLNLLALNFQFRCKILTNLKKNNPEIRVNVFGYDKSVHILRINKTDPQNAIDLLLITNEEK